MEIFEGLGKGRKGQQVFFMGYTGKGVEEVASLDWNRKKVKSSPRRGAFTF